MKFKMVPSVYLEPRVLMFDTNTDFFDSIARILCDLFQIETYTTEHELFEVLAQDKKIEDILDSCYQVEGDDDETTPVSFRLSRMVLNFQEFAQKMYTYYTHHEFVSIVCVGEGEPFCQTRALLTKLKSLPISVILMHKSLEDKELLDLFQHREINTFIKKEEGAADALEVIIKQEHLSIIEQLNIELFGRFSKTRFYSDLFLDKMFITFFEKIINNKSIVFACVYAPCGSFRMQDREGNNLLLNIYSESEINDILFCSEEYEKIGSASIKKALESYTQIVDYKHPTKSEPIDSLLSEQMRSDFVTFWCKGKRYFVVLTSDTSATLLETVFQFLIMLIFKSIETKFILEI